MAETSVDLKLGMLIAIILIFIFVLIWTGLAQAIVKYAVEQVKKNVLICNLLPGLSTYTDTSTGEQRCR